MTMRNNRNKTSGNKKSNFKINSLYDYDPAIKQSNNDANSFEFVEEFDLDFSNWTIDDYRLLSNWETVEHNGWKLPATEEAHWWCGLWQTKGCLHVEDHNQPEHEGKAYAVRYQRSCFRPVCKTCFEKWLGRQSNVATRKIERYAKRKKATPIHLVLCASQWDLELDYKKMKEKARKILKEIGIKGGAIIFHPFRFNKNIRSWYYYTHFHVVGFGSIPKGSITESYYRNGWFVKYLGERDSVLATFYYLLSHCGIKKGVHAITWFGDLSYSKLGHGNNDQNYKKCPSCSRKLVLIYYAGKHPPVPPDKPFEDFVDAEGWYEVKTLDFDNKSDYKFEYDPRKETNEILKCLALAN